MVVGDKERAAGKKGAEKAETLLAQMCRVLSASKDLAVQNQVGEALKSLLDQPFEIDAAVGFFFFLLPSDSLLIHEVQPPRKSNTTQHHCVCVTLYCYNNYNII